MRRKKVYFGVLIFTALLILTVTTIEIILRKTTSELDEVESIHTYFQFNNNYGIEPKPNLSYMEYQKQVRTNTQAFFGPEIGEKDTSVPRIVFLGDSYTVGPGISFEENYPFLIQKLLNEEGNKVEIIIAGMGGSSPTQQVWLLKKKILPLQPDLIIHQLYNNDARDDYAFKHSSYYARLILKEKFPAWLLRSRLGQQIYLASGKIYSLFLEKKYQEKKIPDPLYEHTYQELTEPSLEEIVNFAKQENINYMAFYIPSLAEFENEVLDKEYTGRYFLGPKLREWYQSQNETYVDLFDVFILENTEQLNELYLPEEQGLHLTKQAASISAQSLLPLVKEKL